MKISDKSQQTEKWDIFDEWSKYICWKSKNVKQIILMNV